MPTRIIVVVYQLTENQVLACRGAGCLASAAD